MKSLKIGNIRLNNPLLLAPMVDVTDLPYRLICRSQGASLAYTEMLYVSAILHENKKTGDLMKTSKIDRPIGIQITGNNEEEFKEAIPYLEKYDLVDLNCGCPSIRITGNQAGSYLLKNPEKIAGIIKVLKNSGLNVTAKIRLGFKKNNVLKISKEIEKAGADALTIHSRLAIHGRGVPAQHSWIKKVRERIGIPLIANGDVFSGVDAEKLLEIADGVMIARGAIGNPLIFKNILHYLRTGKERESNYKENLTLFNEYLKLAKRHDLIDIQRIKFIGSNFIKGFGGASKLRSSFMSLKRFDEIEKFIGNIMKYNND